MMGCCLFVWGSERINTANQRTDSRHSAVVAFLLNDVDAQGVDDAKVADVRLLIAQPSCFLAGYIT